METLGNISYFLVILEHLESFTLTVKRFGEYFLDDIIGKEIVRFCPVSMKRLTLWVCSSWIYLRILEVSDNHLDRKQIHLQPMLHGKI